MHKVNVLEKIMSAFYIEEMKAQNKKKTEVRDIGKTIAEEVEKSFEKEKTNG